VIINNLQVFGLTPIGPKHEPAGKLRASEVQNQTGCNKQRGSSRPFGHGAYFAGSFVRLEIKAASIQGAHRLQISRRYLDYISKVDPGPGHESKAFHVVVVASIRRDAIPAGH
jgi:hypothetical protein